MDNEISVHRCVPGDEATALEAARALRSSTWTIAEAAAFLGDRNNYLLVAEVDGRPVGELVGYEMFRLDGIRPMMCLYELDVMVPYRRRGIGRALVEHLRDLCAERGYLKMWVLTDEDNEPARALYEACGGEVQADAPVLYWWRFG